MASQVDELCSCAGEPWAEHLVAHFCVRAISSSISLMRPTMVFYARELAVQPARPRAADILTIDQSWSPLDYRHRRLSRELERRERALGKSFGRDDARDGFVRF